MSDILDSILNLKKIKYNWIQEISLNENKIIGTDYDCYLNNFLGILLGQELFFFSNVTIEKIRKGTILREVKLYIKTCFTSKLGKKITR